MYCSTVLYAFTQKNASVALRTLLTRGRSRTKRNRQHTVVRYCCCCLQMVVMARSKKMEEACETGPELLWSMQMLLISVQSGWRQWQHWNNMKISLALLSLLVVFDCAEPQLLRGLANLFRYVATSIFNSPSRLLDETMWCQTQDNLITFLMKNELGPLTRKIPTQLLSWKNPPDLVLRGPIPNPLLKVIKQPCVHSNNTWFRQVR